ncbi:MAG TPA: class I SAM-dependent methyltransferase [Terriglobales bacterium]|nr:class I SAM-dependent methyltransferase [Terriglobales bacterium]
MRDSSAHWDELHENPRFRPHYPNDHVVRFLMARRTAVENGGSLRLLDIGTGAGRHMQLAAELGFEPYGIDVSCIGLRYAHQRLRASNHPARVAQASMLALPFADCSFGLVLSFGAFYYGTSNEMQQAIEEAWRVLVPKGSLFVVLRTTDDYRYGKGERLAVNTYRLEISDTNEYETVQHFLAAEDINRYFDRFSHVSFEKTETTSSNRTRVDSDWLITAKK